MSDEAMLIDTADRLFAGLSARDPAQAWAAAQDMGLPLALVPAEAGGFGLATQDALALVRLAGSHALALPLAETMVANRLLAEAGLALADGQASFAPHGAARIPWGEADVLAIEREDGTLARATGASVLETGRDLAGLARHRIDLSTGSAVEGSRRGHSALLWGAAMRSQQIAGAMERILQLTITHVSEREQFGRPLSRFQAVQHELARLGGEVAAASAAADIAAEAIAAPADPTLPIAAARVRLGEAVGIACSIAQQLHGAIGFTREHQLHRFTTALWTWRDDYGGHGYWSQLLGRAALAAGRDGYWSFVTEAA